MVEKQQKEAVEKQQNEVEEKQEIVLRANLTSALLDMRQQVGKYICYSLRRRRYSVIIGFTSPTSQL